MTKELTESKILNKYWVRTNIREKIWEKSLIEKKKVQGNFHFLRIIRDNQGGGSNRLIMTRGVIVTGNSIDTHLRHNYPRKSLQDQYLRGRVFPYNHQIRYRHKQRLHMAEKFQVNTTSIFFVCWDFKNNTVTNLPEYTPHQERKRYYKTSRRIIERHETRVNIKLLKCKFSNL